MKLKHILTIAALLGISLLIKCHATWDTSTPSGSEAKSLGDDRIREFKTDVQTSLQYLGTQYFPGSDTANPRYVPTISTVTTAGRPTGNAAPRGRMVVNISSGSLEVIDGSGAWSALDVVPSSSVVSADLAVSVAGNGLGGGGGTALTVQADTNTFSVATDTLTIVADSIGSTQIADSVTISTIAVSTITWKGWGMLPILQIQSFEIATASSTTSTSFVNTNITVNITPKLSTSKILVMVHGEASVGNSAGNDGLYTVGRNGSNIAPSGGAYKIIQAGGPQIDSVDFIAYDSPATTSQVTYTVLFRSEGGNNTEMPTSVFGGTGVPVCSIMAMEIAQ